MFCCCCFYFIFMSVNFFLCVYDCVSCVCSACGGRYWNPLELELQVVPSDHVGAGNGSLGPLEEQPLLSTSVFSPACLLFVGILLFGATAVIVIVSYFTPLAICS